MARGGAVAVVGLSRTLPQRLAVNVGALVRPALQNVRPVTALVEVVTWAAPGWFGQLVKWRGVFFGLRSQGCNQSVNSLIR